ncbi:MAG: hypothetical protein H6661_07270 [Ardenticatenaceae bacterium]|nr:hypothetical protein [Ardenticatenaceae bacterium]
MIKITKSLPSTLYTEEYFLTACEGYDVFIESEGVQLSRRLKDSFAMAEVTRLTCVFDVGCGMRNLRHCMEIGIEAYGIDYADAATGMSQDAIDAERKNGRSGQDPPASKPVSAAARRQVLTVSSSYFDRVLCSTW